VEELEVTIAGAPSAESDAAVAAWLRSRLDPAFAWAIDGGSDQLVSDSEAAVPAYPLPEVAA